MTHKRKLMILAGVVVLLAAYFFFFNQKGIVLHGQFLQKQQVEAVTEYQGRIQGYDTRIVVERPDELTCDIQFLQEEIHKMYRLELQPLEENQWLQDLVVYENETEVFAGGYNPHERETIFKLYQNDGTPYMEGMITVTFNGQEERVAGLQLYQLASLMAGQEQVRGNVGLMAGGMILLVFWLIDLFFPRFFFLLEHALSVDNPEPSDFYLAMQRLGWVVEPMIAVGLLIASLFVVG